MTKTIKIIKIVDNWSERNDYNDWDNFRRTCGIVLLIL